MTSTALTPHQLREQADQARAAGDRAKARDLRDRAMALELSEADQAVREAQDALDRAVFVRRQRALDARDIGWTLARIGDAVGLSQQRLSVMLKES